MRESHESHELTRIFTNEMQILAPTPPRGQEREEEKNRLNRSHVGIALLASWHSWREFCLICEDSCQFVRFVALPNARRIIPGERSRRSCPRHSIPWPKNPAKPVRAAEN